MTSDTTHEEPPEVDDAARSRRTDQVRIIGAERAGDALGHAPQGMDPEEPPAAKDPAGAFDVPRDAEDEGWGPEDWGAPSEPQLPHWTEAPTGEIPAVLSRGEEPDANDPWASLPEPTWREERHDWEQEEPLAPSLLAGADDEPALLSETDQEVRQPWSFDLDTAIVSTPAAGPAATDDFGDLATGALFEERSPDVGAHVPSPPPFEMSVDDERPSDRTTLLPLPAAAMPDAGRLDAGRPDAQRPDADEQQFAYGEGRDPVLDGVDDAGGVDDDADIDDDIEDGDDVEDGWSGQGAPAALAFDPHTTAAGDGEGRGERRRGAALSPRSPLRRRRDEHADAAAVAADTATAAADAAAVAADTAAAAAGTAGGALRTRPLRARHGARTTRERRVPGVAHTGDDALSQRTGRNIPAAIASGVVIGGLALIAFHFGTVPSMVVVTAVLSAAAIEAYAAFRRVYRPATLLGVVAVAGLTIGTYDKPFSALPAVAVLLVAATFLWHLAGADRRADPVRSTAATLMVFAWVGVFGSFAALLLAPSLFPHRTGIAYLLGALIAAVAYDVGALVAGTGFGKHPLNAASPGKTWEGAIGGAAVAIVVAVAVVHLIHPWTLEEAAVLGVVVAVVSPIGDLCESLLKRHLGLKDMGRMLPGHGGLLDRVDGLLFVLPATYYLLRAFGHG